MPTDPAVLTTCIQLRQLHVGLCLIALRDDLGYVDGWDDGIRAFLGPLAA